MKSTAILFDEADHLIIGIIQGLMLVVMVIIGHQTGLAIAAVVAAYQQYLIKDWEPAKCFQAFLNNNWLGSAIFCGMAGDYLLVQQNELDPTARRYRRSLNLGLAREPVVG